MRRSLLLMLSAVTAFAFVEIVLRDIAQYPRYPGKTRQFYLDSDLGPYSILKWHGPYNSFFSVEGGLERVSYNNIGLPGVDIDLASVSPKIFLLGDSFIEARQYDGSEIASGILQEELEKRKLKYSVVNLGASGHDPYVLWYRSSFFEDIIKPEKTILVYESFERLRYYFNRWNKPLLFSFEKDFGKELPFSFYKKVTDFLRSKSSFLNLLTNLSSENKKAEDQDSEQDKIATKYDSETETFAKLLECLQEYKEKYAESFCFVSLMQDCPYDFELEKYCTELGIEFRQFLDVMNPANLINGTGHLNQTGNKILAQKLCALIEEWDDA